MIIKGLKNIRLHLKTEHQKNVDEWCDRRGLPRYMAQEVKREYYRRNGDYGWGASAVSDYDEDYVFDALFDVPNRWT